MAFVEVQVLGEGYPRTINIDRVQEFWIPTTHTDHCRVRMADGVEHTITMSYRAFFDALKEILG